MTDQPVRRHASSASPLEPIIGFSRAVRAGNLVCVAGTAPIGADGTTVGVTPAAAPDEPPTIDITAQTERCFEIALAALADVGAGVQHVVRTRMMLTDITRWREAAAVHGRLFGSARPPCTFVEVSRFIDPDWVVEIEVDAYVHDDGD
jgi:enamine deaminase RidA (YjgF/YER057c/UK114 family)